MLLHQHYIINRHINYQVACKKHIKRLVIPWFLSGREFVPLVSSTAEQETCVYIDNRITNIVPQQINFFVHFYEYTNHCKFTLTLDKDNKMRKNINEALEYIENMQLSSSKINSKVVLPSKHNKYLVLLSVHSSSASSSLELWDKKKSSSVKSKSPSSSLPVSVKKKVQEKYHFVNITIYSTNVKHQQGTD